MLKKCLFILLFFILFVLLFQLDVFATDITFEDSYGNKITTSLPEDLPSTHNFIIIRTKTFTSLISTDKNNLGFYFDTFDIFTNFNNERTYVKEWNYNYDTNSFIWNNDRYYFGGGGRHPSSDFDIYYCSSDFYVYCQHDIDGLFADNEVLAYDSNYTLDITSEYLGTSYRLYTNYFSEKGIQPYWTAYIWTLSEEEYKPLEECSPIEGSGWVSFDNYETKVENDINYVRYYYDVTDIKEYTVCFFNSLTNKYHYFTVDPESSTALNLHLSTTEKTTDPIYVLSNRYYYEGNYDASKDFLNNYDIDVSYGYEETFGYAPLAVTGYDEEKQMNYREYQFKIVVNGIYTFRILNFNTGETTYQTFNVDNIGVYNKWGEDVYYDNYNDKGEFDPTPVLFLEYVDTTTVRIRTQPFSFNEIIMLQCFTKFKEEDFTQNRNIYQFSVDTGNTIYDDNGVKNNNIDLYYFYLDVNVDGLYTFQFYNIELDKYSSSTIDVNIREFIINNVDNIDNFLDRLIAWGKLHFGFLTYPFEFIINTVGRITTINFEEPILYIPELQDPSTGVVFFEGFNYNFNSILEIGTVNTIYNIYLVIVDVILMFFFIALCKRIFEEVFK